MVKKVVRCRLSGQVPEGVSGMALATGSGVEVFQVPRVGMERK